MKQLSGVKPGGFFVLGDNEMTKAEKYQHKSMESVGELLRMLNKEQFVLDCGHHVTFGQVICNDIKVHKNVELHVICSQCRS